MLGEGVDRWTRIPRQLQGENMNRLKNIHLATLIRFLCYFSTFAVIFVVFLRVLCLCGSHMVLKENCIIEWIEFFWLFLISVFLFGAARRTTEYSALFSILAFLPLIAGTRELDGVFDKVFKGAWVIPASAIAMVVLYRIFKSFGQLKAEILRFVQTQQMVFLGIGFFIVVIFSQLMGRQIVWRLILCEHYVRNVGRFVEEILEFLGYVILVIGSIECYLAAGANHRKDIRGSAIDTGQDIKVNGSPNKQIQPTLYTRG